MFFYELHEGDDEVYSDVLVVSESEWEPQEFFELVQRIRHDVQHSYEQDTLVEAIAMVLERDYGFVYRNDPLFPQDDLTWFLLEKGAAPATG